MWGCEVPKLFWDWGLTSTHTALIITYMNTTHTNGAHTMNLNGYTVTRNPSALPATEAATGVLLGEYTITGPKGAEYFTTRKAGWDFVGFFSLASTRTIKINGAEWLPLAEVEAAAR